MSKNVREGSGHYGTGKGRQSNSTSTQRLEGVKNKQQDNDLGGQGPFDGQRQSAQIK